MSIARLNAGILIKTAESIEKKSKSTAKIKTKELRLEDEPLYIKIGTLTDKNIEMPIDLKQASQSVLKITKMVII
jgi:hypothetical protein